MDSSLIDGGLEGGPHTADEGGPREQPQHCWSMGSSCRASQHLLQHTTLQGLNSSVSSSFRTNPAIEGRSSQIGHRRNLSTRFQVCGGISSRNLPGSPFHCTGSVLRTSRLQRHRQITKHDRPRIAPIFCIAAARGWAQYLYASVA